MKKIVYKSQIIQAIIWILTLCAILSFFPLRLWKETVTSSISRTEGGYIGPVDDNRTLMQSFVAQYDHMGTIDIYLCEDTTGDSFFFRLFNEENQLLFEEEAGIDRQGLPGYHRILADVDLEVGKMYHIIIQGNASVLYTGCETIPMTDMPYAGTMYYLESAMEGKNMVADYHYEVPLRKGKVLLYGILAFLGGLILWLAVTIYYKKWGKDKLLTVEKAVKYILNPLILLGAGANLAAVFMKVYGSYLLDNTVFAVSTVILAGILLYGVNHNRDGQKPVFTLEQLGRKWPDYLQSVFLAAAIGACCEYMSGLYDIHHTIAERKQMIYFALAVLCMFKAKDIFRLYNLVYLAGAFACAYYYYSQNLLPDIKELDLEALKLTVRAGFVCGFVILNTLILLVRKLLKRQMPRLSWVYAGLTAAFFILLLAFRNGRYWTVALVAAFTVLYLAYGTNERRDAFLANAARAVVMHFVWSTGYAWLHRPFVTFRTARYTHIFHTVTITATYLTMVECVAVVMFLSKFRISRKLKDIWKEALFLGVVSAYMLFTMARTGFFAVGAMAFFALILMSSGKGGERVMHGIQAAGIMILSGVVCVFPVFMIQRNIPAVVSEPHLYDIESYPDDILRGRKIDSVEYMRVGRLADVFAEKIFGIPEGTFDIYGEIAAYNEENGIEVLRMEGESLLHQGITEGEEVLIASLVYNPMSVLEDPQAYDYTNGRTDIFKSYLEQMNLTGHEEMGAVLQDGSIATHAHNIYLQVAYDHGIIVGIVFLLFGMITFIYACAFYVRRKGEDPYAALPAVVIAAVAVAGIVEWIFHLSNPSGFMLMLVICPLIWRPEKGERSHDE